MTTAMSLSMVFPRAARCWMVDQAGDDGATFASTAGRAVMRSVEMALLTACEEELVTWTISTTEVFASTIERG